ICGGDAWPSLKTQAHELDLDKYVQFTGFIFGEKLRRYLSAADICVDSSPSSPYSDNSTVFKIIEYMSLGKPIVVFNLPEHRFSAQQAAVYVPPNEVHKFACAIELLMDDPRRRLALGEHGIHRIKTQLAWEYSVSNLLHAYRKILPEGVQPNREYVQSAKMAAKSESLHFAQTQGYKPGN